MSRVHGLLLVGASALLAGCFGGTLQLRGDDLQYPVSLSNTVYGPNHEVLTLGQELVAVDTVELENSNWTIFYGAAPVTSEDWDLSEPLNEAIEDAGGEAIVGLTMEGSPCGFSAFFSSLPVSLATFWNPLWPGCAEVIVTGTIVRRREGPAGRPAGGM